MLLHRNHRSPLDYCSPQLSRPEEEVEGKRERGEERVLRHYALNSWRRRVTIDSFLDCIVQLWTILWRHLVHRPHLDKVRLERNDHFGLTDIAIVNSTTEMFATCCHRRDRRPFIRL